MPDPDAVDACQAPETVLAFDVGSRRIGVAVGQRFTGDGRGIAVVGNDSHAKAMAAIAPLIAQWRPQALLVGRPLTLEGGEQPASERARGFARTLSKQFGLPVIEIDERHSSQVAARRFAQSRQVGLKRRGDADHLDADAAAVLIERFYDAPADHLPMNPNSQDTARR